MDRGILLIYRVNASKRSAFGTQGAEGFVVALSGTGQRSDGPMSGRDTRRRGDAASDEGRERKVRIVPGHIADGRHGVELRTLGVETRGPMHLRRQCATGMDVALSVGVDEVSHDTYLPVAHRMMSASHYISEYKTQCNPHTIVWIK